MDSALHIPNEEWKSILNGGLNSENEYFDISPQFLDAFQFNDIYSFETLKSIFAEFTSRSKRYRNEDRRKDSLVYSHVSYACTQHVPVLSGRNHRRSNPPDAQCPSLVNFSSVNGFFKVASLSRTRLDTSALPGKPRCDAYSHIYPSAFIDCGSEFKAAFPNMSCASYVELTNRLRSFEKTTGSVYIKYSSELFGPGDLQRSVCRYKKLRYVCIHYGTRQSAPSLRKNQHTTKIGCSSCFSVKCVHDRLHIVNFDMRHCHPVDPASALMYPKNRRLNPREAAEIEHLLDFSFDMEELKKHIKEKYGKLCTTRDIINMRIRRKKKLQQQQQEQHQEEREEEEDDGLDVSFTPDGDNSLNSVGREEIAEEEEEDNEGVAGESKYHLGDSDLGPMVELCYQPHTSPHVSPSAPILADGSLSCHLMLQELREVVSLADDEDRARYLATLRMLVNGWRQGRHPLVTFPSATTSSDAHLDRPSSSSAPSCRR
ncbi:hypothetical protein AAHC03_09369 [Spirometra sp. Aus1]